jgi:hypothetical protein
MAGPQVWLAGLRSELQDPSYSALSDLKQCSNVLKQLFEEVDAGSIGQETTSPIPPLWCTGTHLEPLNTQGSAGSGTGS